VVFDQILNIISDLFILRVLFRETL